MKDARGREVRYLRVSITDRCDFRCRYCMPGGRAPRLPRAEILTYAEILAVARIMVEDLGIARIRVTGGEPLLRHGAVAFLGELAQAIEPAEVSLTTNGFFLEMLAQGLREAGVRRINVSLDSLDRERFRAITGVDALDRVIRGIDAARAAGFDELKLNTVLLAENLDEVPAILAFALDRGIEARFIERMPFGGGDARAFVTMKEARARLETVFSLVAIRPEVLDGPATRFRVGDLGACGFIPGRSAPFCDRCNRIRLRADGRLTRCLKETETFDLKPVLRPELHREHLRALVETAIRGKTGSPDFPARLDSLAAIGG